MKTIHKLFLIATIALGLGFVACSDSDVVSQGVDDAKTNTHVSVSLKLSTNASTRAGLPDDYNKIGEWAGKDVIDNITVYLVDGSSVTSKSFTVGAGKDYVIDGDKLVPTKEVTAIKTTAGPKTVYVLINAVGEVGEVGEVAEHLAQTSATDFEKAYQETALALENVGNATTSTTSASKLAVIDDTKKDERIVMTNVEPASLIVQPNVTAEETLGNVTLEKNRVSLEVERAVARVMVTTSQETYNVLNPTTNGPSTLGTISKITYVAAQGENSLFVQRKSDWATPNYGWVPGTGAGNDYNTNAAGKYDYSGLFEGYVAAPGFGGTEVATMDDYATNPFDKITGSLKEKLSGKFVLPTTHKVATGDASDYKKGNTPYVLIRALFTPDAAVFADGGTYTPGHDFFVGGNGKFYTSALNALTPDNGGVTGQTVAKYVGGKVLYYAWLNPDNVPDWYNSPVLRNNIYHIHITGFKNLGTNWNPLFPEDPDKPKTPENGGNPDPKPKTDDTVEPENPIDPEDPLTTPETWMSVDVKVLPWKVHSYGVDLGI